MKANKVYKHYKRKVEDHSRETQRVGNIYKEKSFYQKYNLTLLRRITRMNYS